MMQSFCLDEKINFILLYNNYNILSQEMAILKNVANILSVSRIAISFLLLFFQAMSVPFLILYACCGFTDMLDGAIARKTHTESKLGATLDSIGDFIMVVVVLIKLIPAIWVQIPVWCFVMIAVIASIRTLAYLIGIAKFHGFASLHTILNKSTGVVLFLFPFYMLLINIRIASGIACVIALCSAIEELFCELKMKEYNPNVKSILELIH